MSRARWVGLAWFVAVVGATAILVAREFRLWPDSRLPADVAAKQLRARLDVPWTFICERAEDDGSLPADIDYFCQPSRAQEEGWWIDTDENGIELVAQSG